MNCSNCGAENEAGARFCVSCGAPLDSPVNPPDFPPELDNDRTILSSTSRIIDEEAKTMAVTSDQLASFEPESASSSASSAYEFASPPSYLPPVEAVDSGSGKSGFFTTRNIVIMVVVVILLLICCCCSLFIGGIMANPEMLEDLGLRLPFTWLGYI